jgi:hypothetical protein
MCKIEELFKQWLDGPSEEDFETIAEAIDQNSIKIVQKAFFEGYELGKKYLLKHSAEEQLQK